MEEQRKWDPETPAMQREVMPKETAVEKRSPNVPITIGELEAAA